MDAFDFLKPDNTIPLPTPEFFQEINTSLLKKGTTTKPEELRKHEKAYDAYCRWSALPDEQRKPITHLAFESRWKLPKGYTARFRHVEDYQERRMKYFWEWLMDLFPNIVYAAYKAGIKGNATQVKTVIDLIAKHINIDKPPQTIQNILIQGVSQEKINQLAVPQGYEKIQEGEVAKGG